VIAWLYVCGLFWKGMLGSEHLDGDLGNGEVASLSMLSFVKKSSKISVKGIYVVHASFKHLDHHISRRNKM
jgi:hypothetical protein